MKTAHSITDAKADILKAVYRLRHATVHQVSYWSDMERHTSRTYALLSSLNDAGMLIKHDAMQPYIFSLSRDGFKTIGVQVPRGTREPSWSVLSHQCHANEVEILLQKHYPGFRFLPKSQLYRMGLNPGIAEHCGLFEGQFIYVVVDDYYMQSQRLAHVINRPHRPKARYFDFSKPVPTWSEVASKFICAAASETQYALHRSFLKANKLDFATLKFEALW